MARGDRDDEGSHEASEDDDDDAPADRSVGDARADSCARARVATVGEQGAHGEIVGARDEARPHEAPCNAERSAMREDVGNAGKEEEAHACAIGEEDALGRLTSASASAREAEQEVAHSLSIDAGVDAALASAPARA